MAGWTRGLKTTASKRRLLASNELNNALTFTDERIHDLYHGNAFFYATWFKFNKNKIKDYLLVRPGNEWMVLLNVLFVSKHPAELETYGSPTIAQQGNAVDPPPFNRNVSPESYRPPYLEIYEDGIYANGVFGNATRIDSDMQFANTEWADGCILAHGDAGLTRLKVSNLHDDWNFVNVFFTWREIRPPKTC